MLVRLLFIAFFIFCISPINAVNAQDAPAPAELFEDKSIEPEVIPEPETPIIPEAIDPNKKPLPFSSYDDIPQEALDDAHDFFQHCEKHPLLPTHYDCRCWGSRYLEERIKLGPNVSRVQVMMEINDECYNIPGAAGYAYGKCQSHGRMSYDGGMSPEEYCQCVGNNYAILLQRAQGFTMSINAMGSLMTSSILRCKTPARGVPNTFRRLDK